MRSYIRLLRVRQVGMVAFALLAATVAQGCSTGGGGVAVVLTLLNTTLGAATENTSYAHTFNATAGATPYTFSMTGNPGWLGLNPTSGALTGTPPTGAAGSSPYLIDVTVTDSAAATDVRTVSLTVNVPAPLALGNTTLATAVEGATFSHTFTATGGVGAYSYTMSGHPGWLSIGLTTGALTGTPPAGASTSAPFNFNVTVMDTIGGNDTVGVTLNVSATSPGGGSAPFIPPPPAGAATYYVSPGGNDGNTGTSPGAAWRTLQHAANQVAAGDIVDIADGNYSRFTMNSKVGTAGAKIVFRATGTGAIINSGTSSSTAPDNRDAIKIYDSHHVIIYGLRTTNAYRAGIRVTESFHVWVQAGVFGNGGTWGIFTDYSDDLVLEGNECHDSGNEHGIYFSNSGDRVIIRGNYCHDNNSSGIQINSDPAQQVPAWGTRGDGITVDSIIENNFCENNGAGGAAGLNFASIRNCDVRNNLIVTNGNQSGIALWDDGFSSAYGSMNNRLYHNTVVFQPGTGRFCIILLNGSTGNRVYNNVFRGGRRGAISWDNSSLTGLEAGHNVCTSIDGWAVFENDETGATYSVAQFEALLAAGSNNLTTAPVFASSTDFSLASGSPGRDDGNTTLGLAIAHDGATRPAGGGFDRGCYEK